jgi:hypothetical protein
VEELRRRGVQVRIDVIEEVSNAECLRRKARADIFVDQLHLGYGGNAVEAWAMSIPTVCGASPAILADMRAEWGELPFHAATPGDLADRLHELMDDAALRATVVKRQARHAATYHAEVAVLPRLLSSYSEALQ